MNVQAVTEFWKQVNLKTAAQNRVAEKLFMPISPTKNSMQIKARAYNKSLKKMYSWEEMHNGLDPFRPAIFFRRVMYQEFEDIEVMLWTGELDKNKKEIYRDDLVAWGNGNIGRVSFERGRFYVEGFYMQSFDEPGDAFGEGLSMLEVVGNIWENPAMKFI